jgi:predicted RNA-binding protein (virulence factor B family)
MPVHAGQAKSISEPVEETAMLKIGTMTTLRVKHLDQQGAWLEAAGELVLLPKKELPPGTAAGSALDVFLLSTSAGPQATCRRPFAQVDEFALLRVSEVNRFGAFMEWGLDKELLVPFREQPEPLQEGRSYLIRIRLDHEGRIVGSARIDRWLEPPPHWFKPGQAVEMLVWSFTDLGAKVIISHKHEGLLYRDELPPNLQSGDRLSGFIRQVREDGKLDVTLKKVGKEAVSDAREIILAALRRQTLLELHDGSTPAEIQSQLGLSKKQFKKAVGGLYKEGRIELLDKGIRSLPPKNSASAQQQAAKPATAEVRDQRTRRKQKRNGPRSGRGEKR